VVDKAPFELSECGWGEFEINLSIHFHSEATDRPAELTHHLKLYHDLEAAPNAKKPVSVK
jgi:YEATS domain-containing protein 4